MLPFPLSSLFLSLRFLIYATALGSQCSIPLGDGSAAEDEPYWLEKMKHQGLSAYNKDPASYRSFRNVKDFGAKGDGVTDDTQAILRAMWTGDRCGMNCGSSTTSPATVYFPQGTYLVSDTIPALYYTEIVGDARKPPTILAAANFNPAALAIFDADPYIPDGWGAQYYVNQNNFFRAIKNLVIDTTRVPPHVVATCIHWQVSQATSLYNIVFKLSSTPGTRHRAVQMENGRCGFKLTYIAQGVRNILTRVQSGGFMGDLIIDGGDIGLDVGNQQFTVRNVTISGSNTGVKMTWNWGWNFQGITIRNVKVGLDVKTGSNSNDQDQGVGGVVIMDGIISDTPIFYRSSRPSTNLQGSIVLNNIKLMNVQSVVAVLDGETILQGSEGESIVDTWVQGNIYVAKQFRGYHKGGTWSIPKDPSLLENGRMFGKGRPTYADYDISQIVSVKDEGAKGDGRTDDTLALQAVFDKFAGCKIFFFDAGTYLVTDTLKIPAGVRLFGEAWAVIAGTGNKFDDIQNPQVVVRVGDPGSEGVAEIGGVIFSTRGPTAGAIVLQWNVHSDTKGGAGLWDSYVRLGGTAGSELQVAQCPKHTVGNRNCFAAFLAVHLTPKSNGYFEGTWIWLADHDFETLDGDQTTIYSARGLLSESQGPVWLVGTGSEHHILVNYNLAGAANHYLGLPQTESPYFQPNPPPPGPLYTSLSEWKDPIFTGCEKAAWGLHVTRSRNILVFGAGLYSFFVNYDSTTCNRPDKINCQREILHVDGESGMSVYSLVTVGVVHPLSIDRTPTINAVDNRNGFGQTVTVWKSS